MKRRLNIEDAIKVVFECDDVNELQRLIVIAREKSRYLDILMLDDIFSSEEEEK